MLCELVELNDIGLVCGAVCVLTTFPMLDVFSVACVAFVADDAAEEKPKEEPTGTSGEKRCLVFNV